jgi:hypothetical protein
MYSKGTEGFKQDLAVAHRLENDLKRLLENYEDCTVTTSQDKASFSDWDLKVSFPDGSEDLTIELKEDRLACVTGNIAVEIFRIVNGTKRDTCLSVTKADAWAYYFNGMFHLINTKELKELARKGRIVIGGDADRARCSLVPVKEFLSHVRLIFKD